jgi:hypothetical protein
VETARVLDTIEGTEDAASELSTTAIELWASLPDGPKKQQLYSYLVQFVFGSRSVDLAVSGQLCNFASTFTDPLQSTSALANCAPLFWRADGRVQEADKVQACLAKATKLAATNGDVKIVLEGLYSVLGWTAYCLAKHIELKSRWVHALIATITDRHNEIKNNGGSVDTIVSKDAKAFYANTAKFLEENQLVPPPDPEEKGGEEEEDDDEEEDEATTETSEA